jgi:hypothetical protein
MDSGKHHHYEESGFGGTERVALGLTEILKIWFRQERPSRFTEDILLQSLPSLSARKLRAPRLEKS